MADDILPSKILGIEVYMDKHKDEIVDFIEKKILQKAGKDVKITGDIFDRLANQLTIEMPFGPAVDMTHRILAQALICSLWCVADYPRPWLIRRSRNLKRDI